MEAHRLLACVSLESQTLCFQRLWHSKDLAVFSVLADEVSLAAACPSGKPGAREMPYAAICSCCGVPSHFSISVKINQRPSVASCGLFLPFIVHMKCCILGYTHCRCFVHNLVTEAQKHCHLLILLRGLVNLFTGLPTGDIILCPGVNQRGQCFLFQGKSKPNQVTASTNFVIIWLQQMQI